MSLVPSTRASDLASSTISPARRCAFETISRAWSFAAWSSSSICDCASSFARKPCSAAARPSAILVRRASSAFRIGGQTYFRQNHTNAANAMD